MCPCFAGPLVKTRSICVFSMSGVSGAGRNAKTDYLFAECNESVRAYGVAKHRHLAEIEQELAIAAARKVTIDFTPHLIPVNRGIHTTIYCAPEEGIEPWHFANAWKEDCVAGTGFPVQRMKREVLSRFRLPTMDAERANAKRGSSRH